MLAPLNAHRPANIAFFVLLAIWLLSYNSRPQNPLFKSRTTQPYDPLLLSDDDFLKEFLNATAGVAPQESSIYRLCNQSHIKWRPELVLRLDDANGGLCNVRNNILDFVHYAIQAGASIVLPSYATRSSADLSALWSGRSPFEGFFDKEYFLTTMKARCPRMVIYDETKAKKLPPPMEERFSPGDYMMRADVNPGQTPRWAVEQLDEWLKTRDMATHPEEKTVLNMERTLYSMDTRSLPANVRRDLSNSMRLRPEARRLAGIVIHNLARRYNLPINPRRPYYPNVFFGAHLRTDVDAQRAGWMDAPYSDYEGQTSIYLKQASERNLSIIYCASGSPEDLHKFAVKARDHYNITVTHKADLLTATDLFDLRQMTWDQQALIDYEVMTRSSYFAGIVRSSFSFNVALRRNVFVEEEGRNVEKHWYKPEDMDRNRTFEDGLSSVWGDDGANSVRCPRGIWP